MLETQNLRIKAVAFDAFGTLVEIGDVRRPFAAIAQAAKIAPARSPMIAAIDLAEFAKECAVPWRSEWMGELADELASIKPYVEARDVLIQVRSLGLKTAVASNLALPYAKPVADQLGDLLDVSCMSFEIGAVKPDAAFYAVLCKRLGCSAAEVLMIGDTWRCDYAGATAAGLHALHLDRRGNATPYQVGVSVRDLCGVLELIRPKPVI